MKILNWVLRTAGRVFTGLCMMGGFVYMWHFTNTAHGTRLFIFAVVLLFCVAVLDSYLEYCRDRNFARKLRGEE